MSIIFFLLWIVTLAGLYWAIRNSRQMGLFGSWPVPLVQADQAHPAFEIGSFGPDLSTEVKFIGRGNLRVVGGTSDAEAWILAVLAKRSTCIFEFGTCTGKTTYLLAANSPANAKILTLTLGPRQAKDYIREHHDDNESMERALTESGFKNFMYSGTHVERKIHQYFGDSKRFNENQLAEKCDLIFIDGSHAYSYVKSDTEKAFRMLAPGGIVLWHDYRGPFDTRGVYKALNELREHKQLMHISGTSLVMFRSEQAPR